jgi:hypothetical protein
MISTEESGRKEHPGMVAALIDIWVHVWWSCAVWMAVWMEVLVEPLQLIKEIETLKSMKGH